MGTGLPEAHTVVMRSERRESPHERNEPVSARSTRTIPSTGSAGAMTRSTQARARDVPIFLSVGYAACHWCHVMERESFVDDGTARYLNDHFVSIKVDREERPDVDGIYMEAVQAMTGRGGWPMSVFLTPGRSTVLRGYVLPRHAASWDAVVPPGARGHRRCLDRRVAPRSRLQGDQVAAADRRAAAGAAAPRPSRRIVADRGVRRARREASTRRGAGSAVRRSSRNRWCWSGCCASTCAVEHGALPIMARVTLDRMADGASTTRSAGGSRGTAPTRMWHVPHFEKMLSDNAQLLQVYTRCVARHA